VPKGAGRAVPNLLQPWEKEKKYRSMSGERLLKKKAGVRREKPKHIPQRKEGGGGRG